jgi:pyruvate ferredoxin oxidoreductase alpha subunit
MHEVVYVASAMRLPIVMAVANRALSAPLSVWGDHSDVMAVRDTGWIQIFVENGQEAIDNIFCAFRMAEDHKVLLPVMVHLDGFHLSHMVEPIIFPEQEEVNAFLPPNKFPLPLDPAKPVSMGDFGPPAIFTEAKWAQEINLEKSKTTIIEVWKEFAQKFGRQYNAVECYRCEDCDTLLMTMGSFSETAMMAIDKLREAGQKVGLIRIRLWRPFPYAELRQSMKNIKTLIVLDRAISLGQEGPVATEVKNALYSLEKKPRVVSFVGGMGGRDISPKDFENIIKKGIEIAKSGSNREFEIYGVRE